MAICEGPRPFEFDKSISEQKWDIHQLSAADVVEKKDPAWTLLYDEVHGTTKIDESQEVTMVITLSHSDTARIQAEPRSKAGLGTQYFWLSKGTFDFFPALTEKNNRGVKNTYSCTINMNYVDLCLEQEARVTFEADNNLDFRLGTGAFRYTKKAKENDLAVITRLSEYDYEMRIIPSESRLYPQLLAYAASYIGNYEKRFGYIANTDLFRLLNSED